jgi:hypothetical protein
VFLDLRCVIFLWLPRRPHLHRCSSFKRFHPVISQR